MDTSKFIRLELLKHDKKQKDLWQGFGITSQAMGRRFKRNAWTVDDVERIADWLGCDLVIEFRDRK